MGGDQEIVTTDQQVLGRATVAQRWLARLGLVAAVAAPVTILVLYTSAGLAWVVVVAVALVGVAVAAGRAALAP